MAAKVIHLFHIPGMVNSAGMGLSAGMANASSKAFWEGILQSCMTRIQSIRLKMGVRKYVD